MKRNSSSGKTEETAAQAAQSENDTYTAKTDRCSRRFGRHFSSGASRRLRAIFFFNTGSDRRLRTSPSRGYCWGLDLRIGSHPRKCSLTRLQGSNEGRRAYLKGDGRSRDRPGQGAHLRVAEGDEWSLRSTSLKTKTCDKRRIPPSGGRR